VGEVSFNGLGLLTAPGRVMTPRAASEQVVAAALARLQGRPARVADTGTGSGALAIAIAVAAARVEVWATDSSRRAVALTFANVRRHGLEDRIHVCHGDLLAPVPGAIDLIVANLPYLPRRSRPCYPDLRVEPEDAVFSPGDGLDLYRRLLCSAEERLSVSGAVILQLHRRVVLAERAELAYVRETLSELVPEGLRGAMGSPLPCDELSSLRRAA
jgi:release factor glutamine methyltransferase